MKAKVIILFLLIGVSLVSWGIFAYQRLTTRETSMAEIKAAFPADSYQTYQKGDRVTLYALKPEKAIEGAENFRGYQIVGKTQIDNIQHQSELKTAFIRGMAGAQSAKCFNPRHGLRVETKDKTVDIVICFECNNFAVYAGEEKGEGAVSPTDLEAPFNQILKNAGVDAAK